MNESIFQEVFVNLEKTNSPDFLEKGKNITGPSIHKLN